MATETGTNVGLMLPVSVADAVIAMQAIPARAIRIRPVDTARRSRGQALIEFAFVMPVTLLLLLGLIDFGRAYVAGIALEGAAREGARLAIDSTQTDVAVLVRIEQSAQPVVLGQSNVSLCTAAIIPPAFPPACAATGQMSPRDASTSGKAVTVTVQAFVPFFTAFLTQRLGFSGIPVEASSSMQAW